MTIRQCSWCSLQLFWDGFHFCCEGVIVKKKRAHTHMQMCSYIYILCFLQIVCPLHEQYYMIEITIMVFLCHWVACWIDCCVCVVTLVLCERASQSAHVYWCSIVCVYVCVLCDTHAPLFAHLCPSVRVCAQVCICAPAHSHISVTACPLWTRVLSKILTHRWVLITHIPQD